MEQGKRDLISIIVPVYNAGKYLLSCADSIIAQTYEEFELLLIDDGSTDNSLEICEKLKEKDERIRIYHHKNCGVSETRNTGIKLAKGRFVTFVDADDTVDRDYLSTLYGTLREALNVDESIAICGLKRECANGKIQIEIENYEHIKKRKDVPFSIGSLIKDTLTSQIFGTCVRLLIPYVLINNNELEFVKCKMHEDQLFFFDVVSSAQEIYICGDPLYFYRYTDNSACHMQYKKMFLKDTEIYMSALFNKVNHYGLLPDDKNMVNGLARLNCRVNIIKNAFSSLNPKKNIEELNRSACFKQKASNDCVALWKRHSTVYLRMIFMLDKYHLLFLMPIVIRIKDIIKKRIRT